MATSVKETLPQPPAKLESDFLTNNSCFEVPSEHGKSFFVVCWYNPSTPRIDTLAFIKLTKKLKNLDNEEKETMLIGDTNCDLKVTGNCNAENLKLIYSEYQLEKLINSYTRLAATHNSNDSLNVTKTLIDHISTDREQRYLYYIDIKSQH